MATHALVSIAVLLAVCAAPGALAQTVQVWFRCSPAKYTAGSAYGAGVRGLLRDVVATAGRSRDVYATVVRSRREEEDAPDGLAICYADAGPPEVCRLCLRMAAGNVTLACPYAASAAILYNNCLLQYTDSAAGERELLPRPPEPDPRQRFSFFNNNMPSARYGAALMRLMEHLAPAAAEAGSNGWPLAAFGQTNITADESMYGFAQCVTVTGLYPEDCRNCIQKLARSLSMRAGLLADMLHEVRSGALLHAAQHKEDRRGDTAAAVLLDVIVATCRRFLLFQSF